MFGKQNNLKKIEVNAEKKKSAPNPGNYQLIPSGSIHKKNQITSFYQTIHAHKKPQLQLLHCLQLNSKRQQSKGKQQSKRSKDLAQKKKSQDFQIQHQYTKRKTSAQNQNIPKLNHLVQQSQIINHKKHQDINKKSFQLQYIVGKGGFGKVWKIQQKKNKKLYAMKQMLKALYPLLIRIMTKKSVNSVINERILLAKIQNPFIVNMHYAFQDRQILYLVMDLMPGGDLRYHLGHQKKFTQIQTSNPFQQNFLLHVQFQDSNIYIPSTQFIEIQNQKILFLINMDISELLILVLLECLDNKIILIPVERQDIWHLKFLVSLIIPSLLIIMLQELQPISSCWEKPYNGRTRKQNRDQVAARQAQIKLNQIPENWSPEVVDFINCLLVRKPINRLGSNGINEIIEHPWICNMNWKKIYKKQLQSPFIPNVKFIQQMKQENFDQDEQITIDDQDQAQLIQKNSLLLRKPEYQQIFKGYNFQRKIKKNQKSEQKVMNWVNSKGSSTSASSKNSSKINSKYL